MKKKYKRKKKPRFIKSYKYTLQDDFGLKNEALLQRIHTQIANEIFPSLQNKNIGDWSISFDGICLFFDPQFGSQLEIQSSSNLPLFKRVKIHIRLLKLVRKGFSLSKAVKLCTETLTAQ